MIAVVTAASGVLNLVGLAVALAILFQQPWFQMVFFGFIQERQLAETLSAPQPPAGPAYTGPRLDATGLASATNLFLPTHIWEAHLSFTEAQFAALGPDRIPPVPNWIARDGTPTLRNPHASRAGVAGTLGFDLPWSMGNFSFGGIEFTNVAIRYKGNGTFLEAMRGLKKSFKLDLNEGAPGRAIAGQKTLNLHNLVADATFLSDTLGYEFYRDAGVPASLTSFVRVFLTLEGRWDRQLLGLYAMIENPDSRWARRAFGTDGVAIFKPVGNVLFEDLGTDWEEYEVIYDPKTPTTPAQRDLLMGLCRLVSHATDDEFALRIGEFLDLDATARFLACESILSNYDGILMNNQNFLLWLDPRSGRFGFSPWDLDHSWGEFGQVGSNADRERASLFHPWVGNKRFLERLHAVPDFATRYRRELTRISETLLVPDRLGARIDELAAIIRPAVAEQPGDRLPRFERAVAAPVEVAADDRPRRDRNPRYQLKGFIAARAASVRDQLEGRDSGVRLERRTGW